MADLDDFFAKKDRKKSKSVKKFATADELTKKLDDTKQKSDVRPKKERPIQEGDEGGRAGEEEEWKEYEEPVKDYTGLKIQVLQGGNSNQDSGRDSSNEDSAPDGSGKNKGPWNKPAEVEQPAPPPPQVVEEKPQENKPRESKVYVPPVVQKARAMEPLRKNQMKHAPDITNDSSFPTLGARRTAGPGSGGGAGGGWSTSWQGSAPRQQHSRPPLATGNRFHELRDS